MLYGTHNKPVTSILQGPPLSLYHGTGLWAQWSKVQHSYQDYNQCIWLTYGICKSRETVGMPFLQASQDSVDSNTATWNEQIYILVPQNTLKDPLAEEKFDISLQQLTAGWSGQCQKLFTHRQMAYVGGMGNAGIFNDSKEMPQKPHADRKLSILQG